MTKVKDLYTDQINEFVDWSTGIDELTGETITDKQISGGSIRNLLLRRLQKPFYMHYDLENKLYRIFSSEDTYKLWLIRDEFPEYDYSRLELFNFVAPSPYTLNVFNLNSQEAFNTNARYVRTGVSNNDTKLLYSWSLYLDADERPDNMIVTYTITNNGEQKFVERYSATDKNVTVDLFSYLKEGTNTITMRFVGEETKASRTVTIIIECVTLTISSNFDFYSSQSTGINSYSNFTVNVNGPGTARKDIIARIDGQVVSAGIATIPAAITGFVGTTAIPFTDLTTGKHNLQLVARCIIGEVTFYSNVLYYEFAIPENDELLIQYINVAASFDGIEEGYIDPQDFELKAEQHLGFTVDWGYTSNSANTDVVTTHWSIVNEAVLTEVGIPTIIDIGDFSATKDVQEDAIGFISSVDSLSDNWYLRIEYVSNIGGQTSKTQIGLYKIYINPSTYSIQEVSGYSLKLSAVGKTNSDHTWNYENYSTTFNNFTWDTRSGWNNGALFIPEGSSIDINFAPLAGNIGVNGKTIEIEFSTSNIGNTDEEIAIFGNKEAGQAYVAITPNSAYIVPNSSTGPIVKTNFKDRERVKLAFIIFPKAGAPTQSDNGLIVISNNGILERVGSWAQIPSLTSNGTIHIGGKLTAISIYSIRCYDRYITYEEAFNNYAFDSSDTNVILAKNNVFDINNNLDFDLVKTKIDTILITGNMNELLKATEGQVAKQKNLAVDIQRICLSDPEKNFIIKNARIRKHGQSTLNYPVPSFKFWSNSSFIDYNTGVSYGDDLSLKTVMYKASSEEECIDSNIIYKGRYAIKDGIPIKKWVLLANYADSSGTHNGSLLRLIQDTWYNAVIDGQYKLRTLPLLFSSNQKVSMVDSNGEAITMPNRTWTDYNSTTFPYTLRVAPDSLPCVVFYREDSNSSYNFLGQYVLMDDKKADHLYGERSIYNVTNDPFCLLEGNSKLDTDDNRIWDNNSVLRLEVLSINTPFADYRSWTDREGRDFDAEVAENTMCWEQDFELIYPDKDDITSKLGNEKVFDFEKFKAKTAPFVSFYRWLIDCYNDYNRRLANNDPKPYQKFYNEAKQHLDLYKLAAYYIPVLRFGLVDSLERNAQLKTYDGQHWHYEPWDMDIALGNRNTGGIAFDPPINRDTYYTQTENAFSGRTPTTSNFLFDALESWLTTYAANGTTVLDEGWIDSIVPKVAKALYTAGLRYTNAIDMFDNNYQNFWCERIYNLSGHYKYIENGGGDYYPWCQGARTTHRHWWMKTSMDYWDAYWKMGDFLTKSIYIAAGHSPKDQEYVNTYGRDVVGIASSTDTYFGIARETADEIFDFKKIEKSAPNGFDITEVETSTKKPIYIYGAPYIRELDLSPFAEAINIVNLSGCYSDDTGTNLKKLILGVPMEKMKNGVFNTNSEFTIAKDVSEDSGDSGEEQNSKVLSELQSFNIQGFAGLDGTKLGNTLSSMKSLQEFYSIGSGLTLFSGIGSGTHYSVLLLPDTVTSITLTDASWDLGQVSASSLNGWKGLTFWHKTDNGDGTYSFSVNTHIPENLRSVQFLGNTAQNDCAKDFILDWIQQIDTNEWDYGNRSLECYNINWQNLTYEQVMKLARFNGGLPQGLFTGYILLTDSDLNSQQLQTLQETFGDDVFTKNSGGLVIDYPFDQTIVTIGNPARRVNGNMTIEEGYTDELKQTPVRALLRAVKFLLADNPEEATWKILNDQGTPIGQNETYYGAYLGNYGGSVYICVPEMRRAYNAELLTYSNVPYIQIQCTIGEYLLNTNLYIIHKRYPSNTSITCSLNNEAVSYSNNSFIISLWGYYDIGLQFENYDPSADATIVNYQWILSDSISGQLSIDSGLGTSNIRLLCGIDTFPDNPINSLISCLITFKSGEILTVSTNLQFVNDPVMLNIYSNNALYQALHKNGDGYAHSAAGYTQYNLAAITALNITSSDVSARNITTFNSTVNNTTYNIPAQLVSLTSIDLTGCVNSQLNETLDLSNATSLGSINFYGTNLGIIMRDSTSLRQLTLGKPAALYLENCSNFRTNNISVINFSNTNKICIWNMRPDSNTAFSILSEIISTPSYIRITNTDFIIPAGLEYTVNLTSDGVTSSTITTTGLVTDISGNGDSLTFTPTQKNGQDEVNLITVNAVNLKADDITTSMDFYVSNGSSAGNYAMLLKDFNPENTAFERRYYFYPDMQKLEVSIDISLKVNNTETILQIGQDIDSLNGNNIMINYTGNVLNFYKDGLITLASFPEEVQVESTESPLIVTLTNESGVLKLGYTLGTQSGSWTVSNIGVLGNNLIRLGSCIEGSDALRSNCTINYVKMINT